MLGSIVSLHVIAQLAAREGTDSVVAYCEYNNEYFTVPLSKLAEKHILKDMNKATPYNLTGAQIVRFMPPASVKPAKLLVDEALGIVGEQAVVRHPPIATSREVLTLI